MPEVEIMIGGRAFEVACQEGEEHYLQAAARMLDQEAGTLTSQIGRLPEARMLLMAGLMLADRTAGLEDKLNDLRGKLATMENELDRIKSAPAPAPRRWPRKSRKRRRAEPRRLRPVGTLKGRAQPPLLSFRCSA